ncbi:hypothetical protein V8D89_009921 [Ganoderma adspersum]
MAAAGHGAQITTGCPAPSPAPRLDLSETSGNVNGSAGSSALNIKQVVRPSRNTGSWQSGATPSLPTSQQHNQKILSYGTYHHALRLQLDLPAKAGDKAQLSTDLYPSSQTGYPAAEELLDGGHCANALRESNRVGHSPPEVVVNFRGRVLPLRLPELHGCSAGGFYSLSRFSSDWLLFKFTARLHGATCPSDELFNGRMRSCGAKGDIISSHVSICNRAGDKPHRPGQTLVHLENIEAHGSAAVLRGVLDAPQSDRL